MELFLAKLLGIYFIVVGVVVMVRRRSIMPAISELVRNRAMLLVLALIELAAGLALVVAYPAISVSLPGALSLIGWMMVIESLIYLTLPARQIQELVKSFNTRLWYSGGGIAAVAIGVFLAGVGFGMW